MRLGWCRAKWLTKDSYVSDLAFGPVGSRGDVVAELFGGKHCWKPEHTVLRPGKSWLLNGKLAVWLVWLEEDQ